MGDSGRSDDVEGSGLSFGRTVFQNLYAGSLLCYAGLFLNAWIELDGLFVLGEENWWWYGNNYFCCGFFLCSTMYSGVTDSLFGVGWGEGRAKGGADDLHLGGGGARGVHIQKSKWGGGGGSMGVHGVNGGGGGRTVRKESYFLL